MNYFKAILKRCEEIDALAEKWLSKFDFIDSPTLCQSIYDKAWDIFEEANEDWDAVPEWVAEVVDGHIPYAGIPENGSLFYSLGFSVISQDAHLRHFYETNVLGKSIVDLSFPVLAEEEIVMKYSKDN